MKTFFFPKLILLKKAIIGPMFSIHSDLKQLSHCHNANYYNGVILTHFQHVVMD